MHNGSFFLRETSCFLEFLCERTYTVTQRATKATRSSTKVIFITETIKSNFGGFLLSQNQTIHFLHDFCIFVFQNSENMPEICRFYGIIIQMFFNDHNPQHFKIKYGEFEANILIESGNLLNGDFPISKLKLVQAWAEIHKEELLKMWDSKDFHKIKPLS